MTALAVSFACDCASPVKQFVIGAALEGAFGASHLRKAVRVHHGCLTSLAVFIETASQETGRGAAALVGGVFYFFFNGLSRKLQG